jgi:uncharacterized membrane protein
VLLSAIQAPVIRMSRNRRDTRDRLRSELDDEVNRRAPSDMQGLARKLNLMGENIGDVEDLRGRKCPELWAKNRFPRHLNQRRYQARVQPMGKVGGCFFLG